MDLHNHFAQASLDMVGLDPRSPSAEIERAAEVQMEDLCDNYGEDNDCSMDEMVAFLSEWVARERQARRTGTEG